MNRVIDHVQSNLDQRLRLADLAAVAHFSPHHFHRIFSAVVGETVAEFVRRSRLERALYLLSHGEPRTLTEVAAQCGFASGSDLSRSFRRRYGVPPSRFDVEAHRELRRADLRRVDPGLGRLEPGVNPDGFRVELRRVPPRRVVYTRVFSPFRPGAVPEAAAEMVAWAERQGLASGQWLGSMWEDPDIVALDDCRYDIGLEVPADHPATGIRGVVDLPAMTVARVACRGPIDLEQRAIDWVYGTWLPASPFVADDHPFFEVWSGRPFAHGQHHFDLALELPVRRRL